MSWLDKVNLDFIIYCGGDVSAAFSTETETASTGEEVQVTEFDANSTVAAFKPSWLNATRHMDFNISEFVFKKVKGSLVQRGNPRGTRYNIEIYFTGADHLDVSDSFKDKCAYVDSKTNLAPPWKIKHPYYGVTYVHPVSLTFDNSAHGITKITGEVIETLNDKGKPYPQEDYQNSMPAQVKKLNQKSIDSFTGDVPEMDTDAIQAAKNAVKNTYNAVSAKLNGYQQDVNSYLNKYNEVNNLLNGTIYSSQKIISQMIDLLQTPANFADTVAHRMDMFLVQYELLRRDINRLNSIPAKTAYATKNLFQATAVATVAGLALASTIAALGGGYQYKPNVVNAINVLVGLHNTVLQDLQTLQGINGGLLYAFIPDADVITGLTLLVNNTVSVLFNTLAQAKQQRTKVLDYDSNIIAVAWELYGLLPDDSTITQLKEQNNIGLNEILVLKQGREIVYYV